jgi:hypothetical protein
MILAAVFGVLVLAVMAAVLLAKEMCEFLDQATDVFEETGERCDCP